MQTFDLKADDAPGMFMSAKEIKDLTDSDGRKKQREWLDKNGWVYEVSRLGNPKVLRAYAQSRMGVAVETNKTEPNWDAFA